MDNLQIRVRLPFSVQSSRVIGTFGVAMLGTAELLARMLTWPNIDNSSCKKRKPTSALFLLLALNICSQKCFFEGIFFLLAGPPARQNIAERQTPHATPPAQMLHAPPPGANNLGMQVLSALMQAARSKRNTHTLFISPSERAPSHQNMDYV